MKLKILNHGMNGEGVGNVDGKIIFVPNAIKNEIVECDLIDDHGNYANAKLNKILTLSPNRTTPPCPYYGICGGCDLQHMNYTSQLEFKTDLVQKTLKKVAQIECEVNTTIPSDKQFYYRNKISFSCEKNLVGFKQKSSSELVNIDFCMLADDYINNTLKIIKDYLRTNKINSLKNIVIRKINNQTLIAIVCAIKENLNNLLNYLNQNLTTSFGLFLVVNPRKDSVVLTNNIIHVGGIKQISLQDDLKLNLTVDSFYQTNIDIQNKLYQFILNQINADDIVVNGYSGAGVLSAMLAKKAKQVYGIEINKSSHLDAQNLKKCNKISNLTNICGDFLKIYKNLINNNIYNNDKSSVNFNHQPNTIVLDPSKKGCGKDVMHTVDGTKKIIYISCNPIALAKDLREIINDYNIISIQPFDMFPNTISVETCVTLIKKNS